MHQVSPHLYLHPFYPHTHPQVDPLAVKWCAILYNNRAAAHLGTGQLKEAVSDCHQAIARDPLYARAFLRRARALAVSEACYPVHYSTLPCVSCVLSSIVWCCLLSLFPFLFAKDCPLFSA
jgi:hypothetical protein